MITFMELIFATNPIVLLLCSFALATLSVTISRSTFTMFVRDWLDENLPIVGKILSCPYCVAHWIAIPACVYAYWSLGILFVILISFALIGMATIIMGGMMKLFLWQEDEIAYLRHKLSERAAKHGIQERSENQAS